MKKSILLALIFTTLFTGCVKKDEAAPEINFNSGNSKIAYRQDTVVPASGEDLTVNLKELTDSRCPANVTCIAMGSVALTLAITDGANNASVKLTFEGDEKKSPVEKFVLGSKNYAVKVTEVLPYPGTTKEVAKLEDYKVGVSLVKL